jgi:hypothetical protein
MTAGRTLRIVRRQVDWGEMVITEAKIPTDAPTLPAAVEDPEQLRIERAVTSRLQECGSDVPPEAVRDEVCRALERFRDVRVRQFVSILVTRDVCAALRAGQIEDRLEDREGTGTTG